MNISPARKFLPRRSILCGVAGLVLTAFPMLMALSTSAAAGEPSYPPDDIAAYQSAQYGQPYGQPMPPPPQYQYPGSSGSYARHNQLMAQLNYAEAQYNQARQSGNRQAAKYWRKDIKHLQRELSGGGHAEGSGFGASACMPPQQRSYAPPASAYAQPTQEYGSPAGPTYAQPYPPTTPPYGYPSAPSAPYPPAGYPSAGYPNAAAVSPYGAPGASGSTSGLSSLLGPLFGGGSTPSAAGYPNAVAGSPNGAPAATGSMGAIMNSLMGSIRGSGSTP
jgi:hypothetical protein